MRIDGKKLAQKTLNSLKIKIDSGKIQPALAIVQVGDNPASNSYILSKKRAADSVGIKVIHKKLPKKSSTKKVIDRVEEYNKNPKVNGIIVQLPLPGKLNTDKILNSISPKKDIDGFLPNSPFIPPVASAVLTILRYIKQKTPSPGNFVLIGRGRTGGAPILKTFKKLKTPITLVHSKTPNPSLILRKADIIISCVGKPNIITADKIKKGAILIGVGIHRGKDGKLRGDYDEGDIKEKAAYYTPTPGGVGPLTVACLIKNVVKAANL